MFYMETNYVKNTLNVSFNVKSIYTIHYFKYGKNFRFPTESHDFWEMVYIDGGSARILADGKELVLKQGEGVFHAPNVTHTICTDDEFSNAAIISFECSSRYMKVFKDGVFKFTEREKSLLSEIINEGSHTYQEKLNELHLSKMNRRSEAPFAAEQIIKNDIENLLILLARHGKDEASAEHGKATSKTDELAEKIIAILQERLYSSVNLDEIAGSLYFSKTYVKNVFKKHTGSSIIQYYIDLKMDEAKKLISQNKYSFTEIADMLGINSVHYFSRLFKQRTDMSPSEYAKSIKVDNLIK